MSGNQRSTIDWNQGWDFIQKKITKLINMLEGIPETQFSLYDSIEIDTMVEDMCIQTPDYKEQLYYKYRESFEEYITSSVLPSFREKHDKVMLRELVKRWRNHKNMAKLLSESFRYIGEDIITHGFLSSFIDTSEKEHTDWPYPNLEDVGLICWRDLVYHKLNAKVLDAVISLIDQEREGEQIDRELLKSVRNYFVEVGMGSMDLYENDFEHAILKCTAAYYSRKASSWIWEDPGPDYMLKAEECLIREKDRVTSYLHLSSETKLLEEAQHELLSVYATQLLENEHSGCHALLRDDKVEDLSRIFRLFSKIPEALKCVANIFEQHVIAECTALVKEAEDAASNKEADKRDVVGLQEQVFVRKVIEFQDKYLAWMNCFRVHPLFDKLRPPAFRELCRKGVAGRSGAEILASFCHNILKKGAKEKFEAIEERLEKVVKLPSFLGVEDSFLKFYRVNLARRLLNNKANEEHERGILWKLYGHPFVEKMKKMVLDLTLARENHTNFEEYLSANSNANPGIDLTVTVLTAGSWPNYKSLNVNLPAEMVKCVEVYQEFYQTKTKHRKLTWIHPQGTCNIKGRFDETTIELLVTTQQACALSLFNAADKLSYQEIMAQLNLTDHDVMRVLHSLSCANYNILKKEPNTKTISPTDLFEFNSKFSHKMRKIKIPLPLEPLEGVKKKVIEAVGQNLVQVPSLMWCEQPRDTMS